MLNMAGCLGPKVYICLKEKGGRFGPNVQKNLRNVPSNIVVDCSTSGKVSKNNMKKFYSEIVNPIIRDNSLLLEDNYSVHRDPTIFASAITSGKQILKEIIPSGTTKFIQPLDVYFFRQYKIIVRRIYVYGRSHGLEEKLHSRYFIIKIHSITHRQLSHPEFQPMLQYAWIKCGYVDESPGMFKNVTECLFSGLKECFLFQCRNTSFMTCLYCKHQFCFKHFIEDFHNH